MLKMKPSNERIVMMNGEVESCTHVALVDMVVEGNKVTLNCLIADIVSGFDVLLGMDAIDKLGGVSISNNGKTVRFLRETSIASVSVEMNIVDKDFSAQFRDGIWVVKWNWLEGPPKIVNSVPGYRVQKEIKDEYDKEIDEWIDSGWLQRYTGPCDGLIPLMAVIQSTKSKVRPVLDFREVNQYVSSHTANGDVCSDKLRSWRKMGNNLSIVDLRKAYLQIHVDPSLWKYQVVEHKGVRYCLTRLGFGLNVAPKIMTTILNKILSANSDVRNGTDSYVDDIIVNNDLVTNERVIKVLEEFGLEAKPAESLKGGRVLGLRVVDVNGNLEWKRDNVVDSLQENMTRRQLFAWCGQMIGHFPVAGWLRPACSYIKRLTNGSEWDSYVCKKVTDMVKEIKHRTEMEDPVKGVWNVPREEKAMVWCDASSLAIGVCLQVGENIVEDASWLRKFDDASHINLAELESIIKGLNMAILWEYKVIEILTDSSTVCGWLRSLVAGDRPVRVKGMGEALARKRLSLIRDLIEECKLQISVTLVQSSVNKADKLTRVPQKWLQQSNSCSVAINQNAAKVDLKSFHNLHHLGVDRTFYLAKKCYPKADISREDVKRIVESCVRCASIDPAPIRWSHGDLEVRANWERLACDITHYRGSKYLTLIDCGPSRFAIWKKVKDEGITEVVEKLDEIFRERGPPKQLLVDNGATFRSGAVGQLCKIWAVELVFRCAYRPSGNGIIERLHRTIKRMAEKSGGNILQMVYWYNMSPRDNVKTKSVPCNNIFTYKWRTPFSTSTASSGSTIGGFFVGRTVFVKPPVAKCTSHWTRAVITGNHGPTGVEVNGIPRHVADVRLVPSEAIQPTAEGSNDLVGEGRPVRLRKLPVKFTDYVL
jgi:transposase InsO family protein